MPAVGSLLTAVDTNTRSPHTIGLDTATPGTGVFQRTFSPLAAFHLTAVGSLPSATPEAAGPRNDGQFCADSTTHAATHATLHVMLTLTLADMLDAVRLIAYFPSTRVKVIVLPMALSVNATALSCSIRNVTVVPGCSATPNVV
jgi:hypothetical protein